MSPKKKLDPSKLEELDKKYIWHPFTQHSVWDKEDILIVDRAEANQLIDIEGRSYLDGISALWCNVHGHSVPELLDALEQQARKLCHSTLLGASHTAIIELSDKLAEFLPADLSRIFYCDGGSVAVEAALRMSVEWWQKQGTEASRKKCKLVSLASGYHGDTMGSVGLGYVEGFHQHLNSIVVPSIKITPPHIYRFFHEYSDAQALEMSLTSIKKLFEEQADSIAAFVIEPLVQGAAGIWVQDVNYLLEVAALCRRYDVLLICDEIATGFAKTGKMFAIEHSGISPDIMTMGKGLSAGYLPIAAVAVADRIFEGFYAEPEELKTFFFGQTFSGNPLAAAVAKRSLELFESRDTINGVVKLAEQLETLLAKQIAPLANVDEVRQCGLMVGIELTAIPHAREAFPINELIGHRITLAARKRGVIIRPLGNVLVLMPAPSFSYNELERLVSVVAESIIEVVGNEN